MLQIREPLKVAVDATGRKIAYDEVTPANPKGTILLLTGLASKRLGWFNQLEEFGKTYRTIALDHREIGDSDATGAPYTIKDQADDAAAVLRALEIERAHVVGISMGGFISLELALRHPEMVQSLVLVATSAGGTSHVAPGPAMLGMLMNREPLPPAELARKNYRMIMAANYVSAHPETLDIIARIAEYRPITPDAYVRQLQSAMTHSAADRLHQIKVPTLVVHGDADPLVPYANGQFLAQNIPGARLITYSDTGHIPIMERAADFNRDVLAFVGEA
jgi:3-oxoadipate enol-lactonase